MTYKNVPYIKQNRITSGSHRYLQILDAAFTYGATAIQTGLIHLGTVLISEEIANFGRIFEKSVNFEHFVNGRWIHY